MIQTDALKTHNLKAENTRLQGELEVRDQLVQQLSQELFRLVKSNATAAPGPEMSEKSKAEVRKLREQLKTVEQQVGQYQGEMSERDAEVFQLRQTNHELTDRARMLEQVVQELPNVYRKKFAERLTDVRERVGQLQKENRRLHAELQSVSYRLAVRNRSASPSGVELPALPNFGAALQPQL